MVHAELQKRERAQRDDRTKTIQEIDDLKGICVLKLRELKDYERMIFLGTKRESQSTVNQLTVQFQALQDRANCLSDVQRLQRSFFFVARRVEMVMHAKWMINNEGRIRHMRLSNKKGERHQVIW